MKLLQLQYMVNGENAGGLYVNAEKIAAVFASPDREHRTACIQVEGVIYTTAFSVSEILDMLVENR